MGVPRLGQRGGGPGSYRHQRQIADRGRRSRACGLSEEERQKLQLAASGDVRRFLDQVEASAKFVGANNDQNAFNQMWQEIQPLQAKMASGLLQGDSLFAKTINKTLSPERLARRHQAVQREACAIPLSGHDRDGALSAGRKCPAHGRAARCAVELLIAETPVPLAYGQQDYYYVFYQLANLPGEKVCAAVNARQWTALGPLLNQYRHMQAFLVQQGMLPKEEQQVTPRRGRKLPQAAEAPQ